MSKVWLITGAGRGLGRAFVQEAVDQGDKVIAGVRKLDENDELMKNENVLPVTMDVTHKDEIVAAVKSAVDRFGRIDVLINNAGFGMTGAFEEATDEELRFLIETNYFGTTNVIREVLPVMREQKSGMILNISSQAGAMPFLGSTAYCSAKFAVVGLSEALSIELEPFGIQVVAVLPGAFRTDFRDASSMKQPAKMMPEYEGTPVRAGWLSLSDNNYKQEGDPANAAVFLYNIVRSGKLPRRILIGKNCCEGVKKYLSERIDEINSYISDSSQTAFE